VICWRHVLDRRVLEEAEVEATVVSKAKQDRTRRMRWVKAKVAGTKKLLGCWVVK